MPIIGIIGKPRTGKGLIETRLGYDNFKKGHKVDGNYSTIYGRKVTIETMLTSPFQSVDRDFKTLLIQEADKIFDRMKMTSEVNRLLRSLVGQSGKRNLSIYWDTQYLHRVSPDLVDLTEMLIASSVYIDSKTKESICFEYDFFEFDGRRITEDKGTMRFTKYDMAPYYMMYDTYEPTAPIWNYEEQKMKLDDEIIDMKEKERLRNAKPYSDRLEQDEQYRKELMENLLAE